MWGKNEAIVRYETSVRDMHKLVVYQTEVDAQQAAHYEMCIYEMKEKNKKVES